MVVDVKRFAQRRRGCDLRRVDAPQLDGIVDAAAREAVAGRVERSRQDALFVAVDA